MAAHEDTNYLLMSVSHWFIIIFTILDNVQGGEEVEVFHQTRSELISFDYICNHNNINS